MNNDAYVAQTNILRDTYRHTNPSKDKSLQKHKHTHSRTHTDKQTKICIDTHGHGDTQSGKYK